MWNAADKQQIKELANECSTVFFVTNDVELILNAYTHILRIENGKVPDYYKMNEDTLCRLKLIFHEMSVLS